MRIAKLGTRSKGGSPKDNCEFEKAEGMEKKARRARREKSESGGQGQKSEVRDQTSEVRLKLISDLRLLTSVIDDFNGLNGFNDLPLTAYRSPLTPDSWLLTPLIVDFEK